MCVENVTLKMNLLALLVVPLITETLHTLEELQAKAGLCALSYF